MAKNDELREMSDEQIRLTWKDAAEHLFRLRIQAQTERLDAPSELRRQRRLIARCQTILNERRLAGERAAAESTPAKSAPAKPAPPKPAAKAGTVKSAAAKSAAGKTTNAKASGEKPAREKAAAGKK
ncbi:MAG TPA: 50S ribosomal protein L29 [Pirellulales bacterium]|nr:50S ribosomal protein L29 [Pirellulales bacterium]